MEAVRWWLWGLIFFLTSQVLKDARPPFLLWCLHLGASLASLYAALQFWFDWSFFAQGPNPASSFVNRNFFAEYLVCTLPFSALLLQRLHDKTSVFLLVFSIAFQAVTLLMTGTRSALIGLLFLLLVLPLLLLRFRTQMTSTGWRLPHSVGLLCVLLLSIWVLGSIPNGNHLIKKETGLGNALARATQRSLTLTHSDAHKQGSLAVRLKLWQTTLKMIEANLLSGVGAGAWEVHAPQYQDEDTQIETDYYAHNEFLQLLAEYGLVGWLFLGFLLLYLTRSAWQTWRVCQTHPNHSGLMQMASTRAFTLMSLVVMFFIGGVGFPWRMATTGALFAMSLGVLAATDLAHTEFKTFPSSPLQLTPRRCTAVLALLAVLTGLAIYIAAQAVLAERHLVRASKVALGIAASGHALDAEFLADKNKLLLDLQQGIAINPHYRKLTPLAADALASWGDWKNATWVWETVLASRPYIVVMLANAARGHLHTQTYDQAQHWLNQALALRPKASSLASLQVLIWLKTGHIDQAKAQVTSLLAQGYIDSELVQAAYTLGVAHQSTDLAIKALKLGIQRWPERASDGWLRLGDLYANSTAQNSGLALSAYQQAWASSTPSYRPALLASIPERYRANIRVP